MKRMLLVFLLFSSSTSYAISDIDMTQIYASLVDQWREEIKTAFEQAEKLVYNTIPSPDEDLVIPNEDPAKCPCKGTGVIKQGDGHDTPCPFHGAQFQEEPPLIKIESAKCECGCEKQDCNCRGDI